MRSVYVFIALGGAIGACGRFGIAQWLQNRVGPGFPWGTLAVNVAGCLLMGILFQALDVAGVRTEVRLGILVGVLGALTTFSSFSLDTLNLLNVGQWRYAIGYVLGTNAACFLAVWLGYVVTRRIHP